MEFSREWNQDFARPKKHFKLGAVFRVLSFVGALPFTKTGTYSRLLAIRYLIVSVFFTVSLMLQSCFGIYLISKTYGFTGVLLYSTDLVRVFIRLGALWSVYWASQHHKEDFRQLWSSLAGIKLFKIYRFKTIIYCAALSIHLTRFVILDRFVFVQTTLDQQRYF